MIVAIFLNKKNIRWYELLGGVLISVGSILFAVADFRVYPDYSLAGYFVTISVGLFLSIFNLACLLWQG